MTRPTDTHARPARAETPAGNYHSWLWPDTRAPKPSILRDEHNGLVNEYVALLARHAETVAALRMTVAALEGKPIHNPAARPSGRIGPWPVYGAGSEPAIPSREWILSNARRILDSEPDNG